jgi:hypothetical protein
MKINKHLTKLLTVLICVLCLTISAAAQRRRSPVKRTKAPVASTASMNTAELKSGAQKVSTQIKNVSKFVYSLGGVARVIEDLDREIAAKKASSNAPELNARNKQAVVSTIKNLRAGLAALEIEFRTKPGLKNYVFQIQGIADLTGVAEDQATAGQLTESGKSLLLVIEKLSDTLAALP